MDQQPPALRVSDQQREKAAQDIREHFAAGRLTEPELDERVQSVYRAQTEAELRSALSDLPRLPASPQQHRAELAAQRRRLQRRVLQQSGGALGVFLVCTVIWLVDGAHGQFWPVWIGLVAVLALLRDGWRLYGPGPQLEHLERDLARRERMDGRQRGRAGRRRR